MGRENDFEGKVIAITGGASGIGLSTAQILLSRGASVAIGDVDEAAIQSATKTLQPADRILFTKLDVSNRSNVDSWIKAVIDKFGKLSGAANCAGVIGKHHGTRKVEELEDDQWDLIMAVNLTGMMYCMRAQLQNMPGPGSVVCVSSVQGTLGFAKHAAYAASKHGVLGLVRSAAKEVGERNIRVNAVTPGSIQTPLMDKRNALEGVNPNDHTATPIDRMAQPSEVGSLIAWLLSDEATFVSGATYAVDGGWAC
ncbi:Short-chain dehydrogenase/reductase ABA4 [Pseudocercospora fuligena]|uniref:Short-chain dehydrogenase/reductase ABA4 n=1 Tax=Pseudocercospora fuligena TaxID=685502 RepID=A0A8H6RLZ8_9PEZI|nr:Short-chain dehydrogenase/reductase ABA4 [Pseudocercospora fuligena]